MYLNFTEVALAVAAAVLVDAALGCEHFCENIVLLVALGAKQHPMAQRPQ